MVSPSASNAQILPQLQELQVADAPTGTRNGPRGHGVTAAPANPRAHKFEDIRSHHESMKALEELALKTDAHGRPLIDMDEIMANLVCTICEYPEEDHDGSAMGEDQHMREIGAPVLPGFES